MQWLKIIELSVNCIVTSLVVKDIVLKQDLKYKNRIMPVFFPDTIVSHIHAKVEPIGPVVCRLLGILTNTQTPLHFYIRGVFFK